MNGRLISQKSATQEPDLADKAVEGENLQKLHRKDSFKRLSPSSSRRISLEQGQREYQICSGG